MLLELLRQLFQHFTPDFQRLKQFGIRFISYHCRDLDEK